MDAGYVCIRDVVICLPDDTVLEAARRMRDFHVGCLVVVEEQQGQRVPVAVVTDRDLAVRVLASAVDVRATRVREVMSQGIVTARESELLEDCLSRMRAFGIRRLPVVDEYGTLQGLLTFDDLVELFAGQIAELSKLLGREQRQEREATEERPHPSSGDSLPAP